MLRDFLRDERGQDIVEYSLLLVIIGIAAVAALTLTGTSISSLFSKISGRLSAAEAQISEN